MLSDVFAAIGDQAIQLDDLGAKRLTLHDIGCGSVRGHHDDRREPGGRGVGCERTSGIAGRRSGQCPCAELPGARDGCGHPAGLKGARRIQSLVLDEEALQAHGDTKAFHMDQGRHAFTERDRLIAGQNFSVAPEGPWPGLQALEIESGGGTAQVVSSQKRLSAGAKMLFYRRVVFLAAGGAI